MTRALKTTDRPSQLVPAVEEVPRITDAERMELRASLDSAVEEIAAGEFDILTAEVLRTEFAAIYYDDKSDAEIDAELERQGKRNASSS